MSAPSARDRATVATTLLAFERDGIRHRDDSLAVEEPMEIRVVAQAGGQSRAHPVAVTMRTPGADGELATGFLLSEGIVDDPAEIETVIEERPRGDELTSNVTAVFLREGTPFDPERFRRNVYTSSSCGICGRASIDRVAVACDTPPRGNTIWAPEKLHALPEVLAAGQTAFGHTGGLHAAGLFGPNGALELLREDVGRHNAVDKVIGALLGAGRLPATDTLLLVSGRASYELVQKALVAGIPTLAAVGAPSSLAVDLAKRFDATLIGFLRDGRFNVYSGHQRVATDT